MAKLIRTALAAVLLATLAAPPAAFGQDENWGYFIAAWTTVVVFIFASPFLAGLVLESVLPDNIYEDVEAEHVAITLAPGRAFVRTEFTFRNDTDDDASRKLTFPFGTRHGIGEAEAVTLVDAAGEAVPFERDGKSITFVVAVPAAGETRLVLSYEQPLEGKTFIYVYPAERKWGRTIRDAAVVVTAPASFGEVKATYNLKRTDAEEGVVHYRLIRRNFDPLSNLRVSW